MGLSILEQQVLASYAKNPVITQRTWTQRTTSGVRNWSCIATSKTGAHIVAGVNPGFLYKSIDSGATWTAVGVSTGWLRVRYIDGVSNGRDWLALSNTGDIYRSTDTAVTWTLVDSVAGANKLAMLSSTEAALTVDNGKVWTSGDGGITFVERNLSPTQNTWGGIGGSGMQVIAAYHNGSTYASTFTGAWSTDGGMNNPIEAHYNSAISKFLICGPIAGSSAIYVKNFTGTGAYIKGNPVGVGFVDICANDVGTSNGSRTLVCANPGFMYEINNLAYWTEQTTVGSKNWTAVASSVTNFVACASGSYVFTSSVTV